VSPHLRASLPLQARLKPTLSKAAGARLAAAEHNRIARLIVVYLHDRILKDRRKYQSYSHDDVAKALGLEPRQVRASLAHAGTDVTTVEVTAQERASLRKVREALQLPVGTTSLSTSGLTSGIGSWEKSAKSIAVRKLNAHNDA
jgi:hypothetical protein